MKRKDAGIDIKIIKTFLPGVLELIILVALFSFLVSFFYRKPSTIQKDVLYWFYSTVSQSIAGLLAIIGMMAIFRYQDIQMRLRNLYETLKRWFISSDASWWPRMGNPETWEDSTIIARSKELLDAATEEVPERETNNLDVSIMVIESHERVRNNILNVAIVPIVSLMFTFVCSVFSLLFVNAFFKEEKITTLGSIIAASIAAFVVFSLMSIIRYLRSTLTDR